MDSNSTPRNTWTSKHYDIRPNETVKDMLQRIGDEQINAFRAKGECDRAILKMQTPILKKTVS